MLNVLIVMKEVHINKFNKYTGKDSHNVEKNI